MNHTALTCTSIASLAIVTAGAMMSLRATAGPLDPPAGAVSSNYKTLAEVEPRIAVNATNTPGDASSKFIITQPGSYYLTSDLAIAGTQRGIRIAASGVTIDLNGFSLTDQLFDFQTSFGAIGADSGVSRVAVVNGRVTGFVGAGVVGVDLRNAADCRVERVLVADCGGAGIWCGDRAVIDSCIVSGNVGIGIKASDGVVRSCTASNNGANGIYANASVVSDCIARDNGANGIDAWGGVVRDCASSSNAGHGFNIIGANAERCSSYYNQSNGFFINGSDQQMHASLVHCDASLNIDGFKAWNAEIVDCTATNNYGDGIELNVNCMVRGSSFHGNGRFTQNTGYGISVVGSANRIEGNTFTGNDVGIFCSGTNNLIIANCARSNTTNYSLGTNEYGQIITNPGANFVNSNPWANFAY